LDNDQVSFIFRRDGKWYTQIKGTEYGEYDEWTSIYTTKQGITYYNPKKAGLEYVVIDGKEYGPYVSVYELNVDDNGKFRYTAVTSSGVFINMNGNLTPTYPNIRNQSFAGDNYLYGFMKNNLWYVNINGKETGPYDDLVQWQGKIELDGNYFFTYIKNNQKFSQINGKDYGPYENAYIKLLPNQTFTVEAQNGNERWLINNGIIYGAFSSAYFESNSDGKCFYYTEKEKDYVQVNGNKYKVGESQYFSDDYRHILVSMSNFDIAIDGKQFPKAGGFSYLYDGESNSYYWLSLVGRNIMVNQYKF